MDLKLFLVSLVLVCSSGGQDTRLYDKLLTRHSKSCSCNLTTLEQLINRRLMTIEQRFTSLLLEEKKLNENQSQVIKHLNRRLHHLNKQMNTAMDMSARQETTIRHLREHAMKQQTNVDVLQSQMKSVETVVQNLTAMIQHMKNNMVKATPRPVPGPKGEEKVTTTTTAPGFRPLFPKDCEEVYENGGVKYPGEYYIMVQPKTAEKPFQACCKITNDSGWTLIQRRQDGSVNFFRTWAEYRDGFGDFKGEFWLGNDRIHELTSQGVYKLRIEMTDWNGKNYWAEYDEFSISDESDLYRLHVKGYKGTSGDSLTSSWENHDGQPFSTLDRDNDGRFYDNCAKHYKGAWWFKSCFESHLNGKYYHKGRHSNYFVRNGIQWNSIHLHSSLKYVAMMVKPNHEPQLSNVLRIN